MRNLYNRETIKHFVEGLWLSVADFSWLSPSWAAYDCLWLIVADCGAARWLALAAHCCTKVFVATCSGRLSLGVCCSLWAAVHVRVLAECACLCLSLVSPYAFCSIPYMNLRLMVTTPICLLNASSAVLHM